VSADNVVDSLWLGDWADAQTFEGERLCVLESSAPPGTSFHIPILTIGAPTWATTPLYGSRAQLDKCAALISERLAAGKKLLVHCGAGVERSPLTCAWWLVRSGHCPTLETAYVHLRGIRACVADRTSWLEPGAKL